MVIFPWRQIAFQSLCALQAFQPWAHTNYKESRITSSSHMCCFYLKSHSKWTNASILPWGLLQLVHKCLAEIKNLCSGLLTSLKPYTPQHPTDEPPTDITTRILVNVKCKWVFPKAENASIICKTCVNLCHKNKVKNVHPLIVQWELLYSVPLYGIQFTHTVSSQPKLKCPYQLVKGVPPASSRLHRKDVREKIK